MLTRDFTLFGTSVTRHTAAGAPSTTRRHQDQGAGMDLHACSISRVQPRAHASHGSPVMYNGMVTSLPMVPRRRAAAPYPEAPRRVRRCWRRWPTFAEHGYPDIARAKTHPKKRRHPDCPAPCATQAANARPAVSLAKRTPLRPTFPASSTASGAALLTATQPI